MSLSSNSLINVWFFHHSDDSSHFCYSELPQPLPKRMDRLKKYLWTSCKKNNSASRVILQCWRQLTKNTATVCYKWKHTGYLDNGSLCWTRTACYIVVRSGTRCEVHDSHQHIHRTVVQTISSHTDIARWLYHTLHQWPFQRCHTYTPGNWSKVHKSLIGMHHTFPITFERHTHSVCVHEAVPLGLQSMVAHDTHVPSFCMNWKASHCTGREMWSTELQLSAWEHS